jgi:hypothetical protein
MKITIVYDVEIDGELDEKRVPNILFEHISEVVHGVITSEDVGDTEGDWAILVNSWELKP